MAITLHKWVHPKTQQLRVYVNGLTRQDPRREKIYIWDQYGTPIVQPDGATSVQVSECQTWVRQNFPTWESIVKAATGAPTFQNAPGSPQPAPPVPAPPAAPEFNLAAARATFEGAMIVHLAPAARMAGLTFKSGSLNKAGIIERLCADPEKAQRALGALEQLRAGRNPAQPAFDESEFDDTDGAPPQPAPAQPQPETPSAAASSLAEYAKLLDLERVRATLQRGLDETGEVTSAHDARLAQVDAKLAELLAKRPQVIQFPERPAPIKVEGITHPQFADLLLSLRAGLHCMLVGPAGAGKTFAAEQAASALERKFYLQGAVSYAHELLGYIDAHSRYVRTAFRDAFEHGGLILLDEFDASSAEAPLVLNPAMANGSCAFPDGLVRKHPDFLCVLGANTDGSGATMQYAGRARLDGAFLDRFVVFRWGIDPKVEDSMARGQTLWLECVRAVRAFAASRGILDVVATPRATSRGALLLSQGMDRAMILERTMQRGALVEAWRDVCALPPVARFLKGEA